MAYDFGIDVCFKTFDIRLGSTPVTHCVSSEVDAHVHGSAKYYGSLHGNHDPTHLIREAGWKDFEYTTHLLDESGREQTLLQLADHFGVVLYLATVPRDKQHDRHEFYDNILEAMDVKDEGVFGLMEEADWDLKRLYAKLKGAYQFPTTGSGCPSSALSLQGSIMQFPWKLYNIPFYKRKYDTCKRSYLAAHPAGETSLSLVAVPDAAIPHHRTWQCPQPGCGRTATQPKAMIDHLAEHAEYDEATVNLGTIRYNISNGEASIQHRSRKIQQKAAQQHLGGVNVPRKHRAKRNRSEQDDDKFHQVFTAIAKMQKDSDAEKADSRKRHDQMLEIMMRSLNNQDEQLKLLASQASNSVQRSSPNISLAQAEAVVQMHKTWNANAVDM